MPDIMNIWYQGVRDDMRRSLSAAAAEFGTNPIPSENRPAAVRAIMSMFPEVSALLEGADVMRACQLPDEQSDADAALKQNIASLELKFDLAPPNRVFILDESGPPYPRKCARR
jgi:hypothetical protein